MPTLRFSRDRRGYESTYLLHAVRRGQGGEPSQLLYWFRSPPHVKIGRAAFDEDAIRMLEQQHPDVEFDWDRILTAKPPALPESRDPRESRPARRVERRGGRENRRIAPVPSSVPASPVVHRAESSSTDEVGPPAEQESEPVLAVPAAEPIPVQVPEAPHLSPSGDFDAAPPARRFVRVFDAPESDARPAEYHAADPSAVERLLGAEQLTVLRARYAEILARISARGGDPARVEALREQAAAVDPDSWVTEGEVTAGLARVDATLAELHRIVGRRRRRRRRRPEGRPRADALASTEAQPADEVSSEPDDGTDDDSEGEDDDDPA